MSEKMKHLRSLSSSSKPRSSETRVVVSYVVTEKVVSLILEEEWKHGEYHGTEGCSLKNMAEILFPKKTNAAETMWFNSARDRRSLNRAHYHRVGTNACRREETFYTRSDEITSVVYFSFWRERDRKSESSSRNCCSSLSERVIISRRVIEQIIFDCQWTSQHSSWYIRVVSTCWSQRLWICLLLDTLFHFNKMLYV